MEALQSQAEELQNIHCLGEQILASCHPDSIITLKSWISVTKTRYEEVQTWAQQQGQKIEASLAALEAEREEIQRLLDWISSAEESLTIRDQEPLAESTEQIQEVIEQHSVQLFLHLTDFICFTHDLTPVTVYNTAFAAFALRKPAE